MRNYSKAEMIEIAAKQRYDTMIHNLETHRERMTAILDGSKVIAECAADTVTEVVKLAEAIASCEKNKDEASDEFDDAVIELFGREIWENTVVEFKYSWN